MTSFLRFTNGGLPVSTEPPTVIGVAGVNRFVQHVPGTWTYNATSLWPILYPSQKWQRCDTADGTFTDVSGAVDPIYQATGADQGKYLRVVEGRQNGAGTAYAASDPVGPVIAETRTVVDLATFGIKALQTTGSITAGQNTLTVASAAGFAVNDHVIVEIGGEPGAGLRGTIGVGGVYPSLSYATADAMNADHSKPNDTRAWVTATGVAYSYSTTTSTWSDFGTDYYDAKAKPLALLAAITGIAGNVLTLDATASATATNANVYFDNAIPLRSNDSGPVDFGPMAFKSSTILTFPAGVFACSELLQPRDLTDCWIKGAGKTQTFLFSPKGAKSLNVLCYNCIDSLFSDLHVVGNFKDEGAGDCRGLGFEAGFLFQGGNRNVAYDMIATNVAQIACGTRNANNIWARNIQAISDDGHQIYVQWMFLWADSIGGGSIDCSVTSPYMLGGCEMFRSVGVRHVRITCHNAGLSSNTSGPFLYDRPTITIAANTRRNASPFWPQSGPIIDLNTNIGNTSGDGVDLARVGGACWYPNVTQAAYYDENNDILPGLIISPYYYTASGQPNVFVMGGYPHHPELGGLFDLPASGGGGDGHCVAGDGTGCVIGIRVKGGNAVSLRLALTGPTPTGVVRNCVMDVIHAPIQSGNQTNAEYEAL